METQVDEIAEVIAAHYLEAYRAAPDDDDASEIKAKAADTLVAAGERAASLAASVEALRYYKDAAELAGQQVACPHCHQPVMVPGEMGPPFGHVQT